ncbi:MAG: hypothetical protein WD795_05325 [Woeseia sp.]
MRKAAWRLFHNYAPDARVLYILGAQRSGTTLLLDCLEKSAEFDVLGESSSAMQNFRIRSDEEIKEIITSSKHKVVVFKPLTDSHRAREFLDLAPNSCAIWAFRRVEDRANSAVAKFGDHNLQVLRELAEGEGFDRWQAQGLSDENLALIRGFDLDEMKPEAASALFWYIRNSLYFSNGLDRLDTVLPLAYEDLASEPEAIMRGVCRFAGGQFTEKMVRDVHAKSIGRRESKLPERIQDLCTPMYEQLHQIQLVRWRNLELAR